MRRMLRGAVAVVVTIGTVALPVLPASAGVSREVAVDVRPPNINLAGGGALPVAILTTAAFDATSVNPATVCFGDAENATQRDCTEAHGTGHIEDVDGDRDADLLLHYDSGDAGLDAGDTTACLQGTTFGGQAVHGCDTIAVRNGTPEADLPDLAPVVTASPASAGPGGTVTWTATLGNEGPGAVTFAPGTRLLRLTAPAALGGVTVAAPAHFTCAPSGTTTFDCANDDPDTLLVGGTRAFTLTGTMPSLPGPVTVNATADPAGAVAEADETDNTSGATAVVEAGNLATALTASPAALAPGEALTLAATVTSAGAYAVHVPANTRLLTFELPAGFTAGAITAPAGFSCAGLSCATTAARTIPAGSALTFTLAATAAETPADYVAAAKADPADVVNESDENDNRVTADLLVEAANLVTTVTAAGGSVGAGGVARWDAELVNLGPGRIRLPGGVPAIGLTLSQPLSGVGITAPSGFTCVAAGTGSYTCSPDATTTLLAGDRRAFALTGTAPSAPGSVSLTTTADPTSAIRESDETDNSANSATDVVAGNLTVTAAATANPVDAAASSTWDATVTNTGGALDVPAGAHLLRFVWPAGMSSIAVSTPSGISCFVVETNTADCATTAAMTLPAGGTLPIRVFGTTPRTPGPVSMTFTVDPLSVIPETNEGDNVALATTVVQPPDLTTTLTVTPDPAEAGFTTTWVARITNDGPSNARVSSGMTLVRFEIPAGFTSLAVSTPTGYTCFLSATLVVDCTTTATANIPAGGTVDITLFATPPRDPGTFAMTAIADPLDSIPEGDETDNAATRSLTTNGPDLSTTLTVTPDPALANSTSTWVARITNDGPARARIPTGTTVIRWNLPTGFASLAASTGANFTCFLAETNVVECTTSVSRTMAVGESYDFTLFATPREIGAKAMTVTADPLGGVPEEDETDNAATREVTVRGPNLIVAQSSTPTPALANQTLTWTTDVINEGPAPARFTAGTVLLRYAVPTNVGSLAVSTPSGITCALVETNVVECSTSTTQTLAAGATYPIAFFMTPRRHGPLSLTATADPGNLVIEENETDNAVTTSTDVRGPDLGIALTVTPDPVDLSHTSTWVARITNDGLAGARVVTGSTVVRLEVPSDFGSLAVATPSGITCHLASAGVVECVNATTQTLAAGSFWDVTLFATPRGIGERSVTATADPLDAVIEEDEADNAATTTVTVQPPDLATTVTAASPSVAGGSAVSWAIRVLNEGPARARIPSASKVRVSYPADLVAPAFTAPSGWSCTILSPGSAECAPTTTTPLAVGEAVTFTLDATAPAAPATLTVSANADDTLFVQEEDEFNNSAAASVTVV